MAEFHTILDLLIRRPFPVAQVVDSKTGFRKPLWPKYLQQEAILLLLKDFVGKSREFVGDKAALVRGATKAAFHGLSPFIDELPSTASHREKVATDIVIVTVLEVERNAALVAFGIDPKSIPAFSQSGYSFYRTKIESRWGRELDVFITMIGEARGVPAATICNEIIHIFDFNLCVLAGIAAGYEEKVGLGDCVAASAILDFSGGRRETIGIRPRYVGPVEPPAPARRYVQGFNPIRHGWVEEFRTLIPNLVASGDKVPIGWENMVPRYHLGIVASSEQLIADGALEILVREREDRVRAGEMEAHGFAKVMSDRSQQWLVFRGVSDFGDGRKDKDARGDFQPFAALSCATIIRKFLELDYVHPSLDRDL